MPENNPRVEWLAVKRRGMFLKLRLDEFSWHVALGRDTVLQLGELLSGNIRHRSNIRQATFGLRLSHNDGTESCRGGSAMNRLVNKLLKEDSNVYKIRHTS